MEPAAQSSFSQSPELPAAAGELVVLNRGKTQGKRLPLKAPLTFMGKAAGCDFRLKGKNIEAMHCLLVHGPESLLVRDLDTSGGTFVNGQRITNVSLREGDVIRVGEFEFQVRLPESFQAEEEDRDALRIQAAAVAAQQAALGEDESRLQQRQGALAQQEEQLSHHLEDKHRRLVVLGEKTQSQRAALEQDRAAYEHFVEQVLGDLTQAQRELVENQQKVQVERRRLSDLHRRLRERWRRHWLAEKQKLLIQAEEQANEEANLAKQRDDIQGQQDSLTQERLKFTGQYELGRREIRQAWIRLRQAQQQWRHRRRKERAALSLRGRELEDAELALQEGQKNLFHNRQDWERRRLGLEKEVDGLNQRIRHQRDIIFDQQQEIRRLEMILNQRRQDLAQEPGSAPLSLPPPSGAEQATDAKPSRTPEIPGPAGNDRPGVSEAEVQARQRLEELNRLAGELADQRLHLAEHWQELVQAQEHWQQDRHQAARELEEMAGRLQEKETVLQKTEESLGNKHLKLTRLGQKILGWNARLQSRETSFQGRHAQMLTELRNREKLVEHQLKQLETLRKHWTQDRQREMEKLQAEWALCENLRKEWTTLRQELLVRQTRLEQEKRVLGEKFLALEEFRQETFIAAVDAPAAQKRIERLRRRWITQNADHLRAITRERQALQTELANLEARMADWHQRAEVALAKEKILAEKKVAYEHQLTLDSSEMASLKQAVNLARNQEALKDKQLAKLKDELERVAHGLLNESDPPADLVDKAA